MKKLLMGEKYMLLQSLITELEDSVSFMETLSEFEDEEGTKRRESKEKLVEEARKDLDTMRKDYIAKLENGEDDESYRECSECEDIMNEGYLIDDGSEYYCSDACLEKNMTKEEYLELYNDGHGNSYFTAWEG